ncbi:MAG TPA: hemolysin family protein [Symbiobacteriaceae bacterium]|nr:hemolysin family protein [Symbiobacteriaceae bacterium]
MNAVLALLKVGAAVALVLLNGFFVAAEFAIVKVRATRIQQLADEGNRRAAVAQVVVNRLDEHLSATQLGITLSSLALGWIGEPALAMLLEPPLYALGRWIPALRAPLVLHTVSFMFGFSIVTMLHIVLGELVPKSMAIARAERMTLLCAGLLRQFYRIFQWPIRALNGLAGAVLRRMGFVPASERELAHTEDELRMLVGASARGGYLDEVERVMIDNVFDFSERIAREIMVPRSEMTCLFVEDSPEENIGRALEAGYTRFPLVQEDKDHVVGMIHARDLFACPGGGIDLQQIMRPMLMIPETLSVSRLLHEFQRRKTQMAVLVDEYGGTSGLITLEDLVEEIVGDIQDEFDEEEPEVTTIGPNAFEVDGGILIEEAVERFALALPETEGVDTLGGYVMATLGQRPELGQNVTAGAHQLTVTEVEGLRIARLKVTRKE